MQYTLVKDKIKLLKTSDRLIARFLYYGAYFGWRLAAVPYRVTFNSEYRSLLWLQYFKRDGVHQVSNFTQHNRYPYLFSTSREIMKDRMGLKILSYGCSTGEEAFTLREYFPNATIIGVDINKANIKKANRNNSDNHIFFSHDIVQTLSEQGPFDLIFALAVLQRTENRDPNTYDSSQYYPFEKFNAKVSELDAHLRPEGIFVIDHADYLFEESDSFTHYRPFDGEEKMIRNRPKFNKQNQRMNESPPYNRIFIKQQDIQP